MPVCAMRESGRVFAAAAALALAGCSQQAETDAEQAIEAPTSGTPQPVTGAPSSTPDQFSGTAWRSIAEDGARYTTYFDAGGRYRDLRNGDPWQTGAWTLNDIDGQQLCFTPDAEGSEQTCWKPGALEGDRLSASDRAGRRIELARVDYAAPETQQPEEGDASGDTPAE